MDDDGDLHEQILHIEAHVEELTDIIERCQKFILISKIAIAAGGILILAIIIGAVGFDPTVLIGAIAVVIGRFWLKHEHFEAKYDRHKSRRGAQDRVDQQNGSEGGEVNEFRWQSGHAGRVARCPLSGVKRTTFTDLRGWVMDDMTSILEITEADRLRVFREDDEALAELAQITHARAIAEGGKDNAAGHLDLKIRERRAAMWGYDSPVRFDMVQVQEHNRPSSHEMITAAIMGLVEQRTPAERALHEKLEQLSPERALALLNINHLILIVHRFFLYVSCT